MKRIFALVAHRFPEYVMQTSHAEALDTTDLLSPGREDLHGILCRSLGACPKRLGLK